MEVTEFLNDAEDAVVDAIGELNRTLTSRRNNSLKMTPVRDGVRVEISFTIPYVACAGSEEVEVLPEMASTETSGDVALPTRKRTYNMTDAGREAHRNRMLDYWQKKREAQS